jgi:enoyl-CoA hydratase
MAEKFVELTRDGYIATVTLNRPAKLNSLTPVMLDQLEYCARELDIDKTVRIVILVGSGEKAFCVGADINEWAKLEPLDMWRRWVRRGHQVFDQWAQLRQPVISAINGHAFGGGLELAIVGDIRISSQTALFALPEASIATCPGWSGTQRLARLISPSQAKYLALSGQRLTAEEAMRVGVVHEIVQTDKLLQRVYGLANEMALKAPIAMQLTKQLINAAVGEGVAATLEAMAGALAATTQDASEGINSFREKRLPLYQGL